MASTPTPGRAHKAIDSGPAGVQTQASTPKSEAGREPAAPKKSFSAIISLYAHSNQHSRLPLPPADRVDPRPSRCLCHRESPASARRPLSTRRRRSQGRRVAGLSDIPCRPSTSLNPLPRDPTKQTVPEPLPLGQHLADGSRSFACVMGISRQWSGICQGQVYI